MSENQQPLDEEQAVPETQETDTLPTVSEDILPAESAETASAVPEEEPEEEDIDPADMKIFGMPRHVFHATCFGAAAGYILAGVIGILGEKMQGSGLGDLLAKSPSATVWAVVVGAVGYFIGSRLEKKRTAARDAQNAEQADEQTSA